MAKVFVTLLALLVAVAYVQAQAPEVTAEEEIIRTIDEDLDLLNLGLPEFEDLEEATDKVEEVEEEEDSDEDILSDEDEEVVDEEDEDMDDDADDDSDVETIKRNQRGKWQRIRGERRRHRPGKWGWRINTTESDGQRGQRHRGRRPWRNQQSITDEDAEGGRHHHRHRKDDNNNGRRHRDRHGRHRPGKHGHRNGRHRHFRFNTTEARHWEGATWQQKVDHICGKLTRHKSRIQKAQQQATTNPRVQTRRERRLEFLGRMEKCCIEEQRDSCFYHLRHKVCEDRASLQPLRQDLPQPVKVAFTRIRCCQMRGWRRHMCFSTPFSSVHEFLRNKSRESEVASEEESIVASDVKEQPSDMDVMVGDMPVVQVSSFDDPIIEEDDDVFDDDDDFGDAIDADDDEEDDITEEEEEEFVGRRRPHHGSKGHRGRHQGRHKGKRKARMMWRRCCKAGRDEGLGVESDEEAASTCGNAATTYLQNVQPREICRKAYEKCCIRTAMP